MHLIRQTLSWLVSSWRFWGALLVVVGVSLIAYTLPGSIADRVRYSGLILQLLGIFTVAHGLRGRRRLFGRPSLGASIQAWVNRRPRWRGKSQKISISGTASTSVTGSADLVFWKVAPKNASVDVQLEALRENVETLKTQQDKLRSSVSEKTRVIEEAVAEESKLRKEATKELSDRMDALGVGGLNVEAAGIFWLTLGVIMATLPGELANFLAWLR